MDNFTLRTAENLQEQVRNVTGTIIVVERLLASNEGAVVSPSAIQGALDLAIAGLASVNSGLDQIAEAESTKLQKTRLRATKAIP